MAISENHFGDIYVQAELVRFRTIRLVFSESQVCKRQSCLIGTIQHCPKCASTTPRKPQSLPAHLYSNRSHAGYLWTVVPNGLNQLLHTKHKQRPSTQTQTCLSALERYQFCPVGRVLPIVDADGPCANVVLIFFAFESTLLIEDTDSLCPNVVWNFLAFMFKLQPEDTDPPALETDIRMFWSSSSSTRTWSFSRYQRGEVGTGRSITKMDLLSI